LRVCDGSAGMTLEKWDQLNALPWPADLAKHSRNIRQAEADLLREGVKPFPITQPGLDAYKLWHLIKPRLLRGLSLELTPTNLRVDWHRQKLKRARDVLVDLELIRPTQNGSYVLGRYSRLDDLTREGLLDVHIVREVHLILGTLLKKSKIQSKPAHSCASLQPTQFRMENDQ